MPETFPDGFPMTPAEAIEYSYFFSETEKQDWREWLTTASSQEQAELVDMLHKIWLDKQKQAVPDQFATNNTNNYSQAQPTQNYNQINQDPINQLGQQVDFYNNQNLSSTPLGDPLSPANSHNNSNNYHNPTDLSNFNYEPEPSTTTNQILSASTSSDFNHNTAAQANTADFSFDSLSNNPNIATGALEAAHSKDLDIAINSPEATKSLKSIDDFDFDFQEPETETAPELATEFDYNPDTLENNTTLDVKNDDLSDFYHDPKSENELISASNSENDTFDPSVTNLAPTKPNPSFSISKIREGATSKELETLYQNYLNNRSSLTNSKLDHNFSYDELMQKVISIVLNFETVADYLEFMVTKLSQMNETIIKQAEEIANFKNGQNNHAHDLEQTLNQVLSKIQTMEINQVLDFEQYRNRLDKLEIRHTGQNNSAYSEYDTLNTQFDLLKSKVIKMEKEIVKSPDLNKVNSSVKLATTIPVPKNNYQSHLPLSQKLKDFTTKADSQN